MGVFLRPPSILLFHQELLLPGTIVCLVCGGTRRFLKVPSKLRPFLGGTRPLAAVAFSCGCNTAFSYPRPPSSPVSPSSVVCHFLASPLRCWWCLLVAIATIYGGHASGRQRTGRSMVRLNRPAVVSVSVLDVHVFLKQEVDLSLLPLWGFFIFLSSSSSSSSSSVMFAIIF